MLVLSLFGRWQGRILQARFDNSGTLNVLASRVYNFANKEDAPWDLFMRYLVCEPKDGPEYEFDSVGEVASPSVASDSSGRSV